MKDLIEDIKFIYSCSDNNIGGVIATILIVAFVLIITLIKLPFQLILKLFVCTHKGHDWRFYGGGFFGPSYEHPIRCKRCGKADKSQ